MQICGDPWQQLSVTISKCPAAQLITSLPTKAHRTPRACQINFFGEAFYLNGAALCVFSLAAPKKALISSFSQLSSLSSGVRQSPLVQCHKTTKFRGPDLIQCPLFVSFRIFIVILISPWTAVLLVSVSFSLGPQIVREKKNPCYGAETAEFSTKN